jgi:hypothetical protein
MKRLYWIMGTATARKTTNAFMMLIEAGDESGAIAGCIGAMGRDWVSTEIDSIRQIDPSRAYQADATLREAIATAEEKGFFLILCEQPVSS